MSRRKLLTKIYFELSSRNDKNLLKYFLSSLDKDLYFEYSSAASILEVDARYFVGV